MQETKKPIIISLGGSVISKKEGVDVAYLKNFVSLIRERVAQGAYFVIVTGGGVICRQYQEAAQSISNIEHDDLDWIGIASTRLNAQLLRSLLADIAHRSIIEDPTHPPLATKPVVIGSGYLPGRSSDHDAVLLAMHYGAEEIINLGSAAFVYDADPRTNPDAKKYTALTWPEYLKIVPKDWRPGLSTPFDPVAAKEAERAQIKVFIADGNNLANFISYLESKKAEGTAIG